jgi:azurin
MKKNLHILAISAFTVLAACSKSPEKADPAKSEATAPPVADASLPEQKIEIAANDQMKFSVEKIEAKPAQKVSVTLKNLGTMPKMSMGHNWVLLVRGTDPAQFIEASQMQMANDYIAPEMKDKVLAHTKLLGPGESETVTFVAPSAPGDYQYVCSFPGHFAIGMKGILTVK